MISGFQPGDIRAARMISNLRLDDIRQRRIDVSLRDNLNSGFATP
jgi:hypothetical protein